MWYAGEKSVLLSFMYFNVGEGKKKHRNNEKQ